MCGDQGIGSVDIACHFLLKVLKFVSHLFRSLWKGLHNNRKEKLKHKERPNQDEWREIDSCQEARGVHVVVHDIRPAFKSKDSKDRENWGADIIKSEEAILDVVPMFNMIIF